MPVYCYRCDTCKVDFERRESMKQATKVQFCRECGEQLQRVPEIPSRMVRGSGGWSSPPPKG